MIKQLAYYPGCSSLGTSREYDMSTRAVCELLGLDLKEIPDWSCCGSSPAHSFDHSLSAALSARNLALVETMGLDMVATPCPSCLSNLKTSSHRMQRETFRDKVNLLLDKPYMGSVKSMSVLQALIEQVGTDTIAAMVAQPLTGLKLAPFYGCIMNRPSEIMEFDDPENPTSMDRILTALGAEVVPFPLKVECCGASYGVPFKDIVAKLSGKLLSCALDAGAEAVVVACPMCQMNLDLRQKQLAKPAGVNFEIPVVYFTQLMGFAMGLPESRLGFDKLCVSPALLLSRTLAAAS
ncbi:MAG: CoB--CoM heterodisulfide reductase iron-sulfur subunit B family protein [Desulfobacteraceae bacterium]|nr:CoB--CoM heterodisulfide reductase iron-sulfur subunit B family protein [Desulfobacteraceae bacterium]